MEWPRKLMIGLIVLNIGLGVTWALLAQNKDRGITQGANASSSADKPAAAKQTSAPDSNLAAAANVAKPFQWAQLESEDYKQYIANLRAVGCPELTIYDIIIAELDGIYEPKLNALKGANIPMQHNYWLASQPAKPSRDEATNKEIKRLEDERLALVKELLGGNEKAWRASHNYFQDDAQARHAFLPPEKQAQVQQLESKYEKVGGAQTKEVGYKNEAAREQMRAEMKAFMTPEEIFEYEIRTSNLTKQTRASLSGIEVNEAEFRAIFSTAYEAKYSSQPKEAAKTVGGVEVFDAQQLLERQTRDKAAMVSVLGEERFMELERNKDYSYRQLVSAAPYLGFDKSAADKVLALKRDTETAMRALINDQSLAPEQKNKALTEMRQTAEKAIKNELGEKGFKYYQQAAGQWLRPSTSSPSSPSMIITR